MILVWFNPKSNTFYTRFYNSYILSNYYVGYINNYNHEVIKMYILHNNQVFTCNNYYEYYHLRKSKSNYQHFFKCLIYKLTNATSKFHLG